MVMSFQPLWIIIRRQLNAWCPGMFVRQFLMQHCGFVLICAPEGACPAREQSVLHDTETPVWWRHARCTGLEKLEPYKHDQKNECFHHRFYVRGRWKTKGNVTLLLNDSGIWGDDLSFLKWFIVMTKQRWCHSLLVGSNMSTMLVSFPTQSFLPELWKKAI